jgi:hypothetical protein
MDRYITENAQNSLPQIGMENFQKLNNRVVHTASVPIRHQGGMIMQPAFIQNNEGLFMYSTIRKK